MHGEKQQSNKSWIDLKETVESWGEKNVRNCKGWVFIAHLHSAGVGFSAAVDFAEPATPDNSMHAKVVHGELYIELQVFPLTKPGVFITAMKTIDWNDAILQPKWHNYF